MENRLKMVFNEIMNQDHVTGCVLSDPQGLALMSSPNIKGEMAGLVAAVVQHAALIDPNSDCPPLILLENDTRQALIHNDGGTTTAIFLDTTSKKV